MILNQICLFNELYTLHRAINSIMNKKIIEVERVVGLEETAIIILRNTGVIYSAQCGGIGCSNPEAEGYVIRLGDFAQDFDDCSYGCCRIHRLPDDRLRLAHDFDSYCKEYMKNWKWNVRFDFERIEETMEGWIPIVINGVMDDFYGTEFENEKGFVHNGNCD